MEYKGATRGEWKRIITLCQADALPSLCNTDLAVNPNSKREAHEYTKTPSVAVVRDNVRCGVGVSKWPEIEIKRDKQAVWAKDSDLGCGLRGRLYRAIDIDVPNKRIAKSIQRFCDSYLGIKLPCRWRADSGKRLLMFRMEESDVVVKRVIPVARTKETGGDFSGMVEFLFDRQFFMVYGTHPDGERYRWDSDILETPTITIEQLADLFEAMIQKFGAPEYKQSGVTWENAKPDVNANLTKPRSKADVDKEDDVVKYLFDNGHALGWEYNGSVRIHCPFDHDSGKYGGTSTVYFPKGVGGRKQRGFKCLHASCESKGLGLNEFLYKIGYTSPEKEIEPIMSLAEYEDMTPDPASLELSRDSKGKLELTYTNLEKVLLNPKSELALRFDTFKQRLLIRGVDPKFEVPFMDKHYMAINKYLEYMGFVKHPSGEMLRQILGNASEFDSAQEWLNDLKWDKVSRLRQFHVNCLQVQDTPYNLHVMLYTMTAMVGRILVPGIQADMVPVFISGEGYRKSTFAQTLAPDPEMFGIINLGDNQADISRLMQGKMILELDELQGLTGRDGEAVRSIITRRKDNWVPKYKEYSADSPRRNIFVGSTNEERFLESGAAKHRRWLPVKLEREINTDYLAEHRDQIFAEAKMLFKKRGVMYKTADALAGEARERARVVDPWTGAIRNYLDQCISDSDDANYEATTAELATDALGRKLSSISRFDAQRIARIMASLGYDQSDDDYWRLLI